MPTDYAGNSKKDKEPDPERPPKVITKVITGEVIIPKRGIGAKLKDLFIAADPSTVIRYVATDVLLPAAKAMIFDALTMGSKRMIYGERDARRNIGPGLGPRVSYNSPVQRTFGGSPLQGSPSRFAPAVREEPRSGPSYSRGDFILTSKTDAEFLLEQMIDIIDNYEWVSVADLYELAGQEVSPVDNKWGWSNLSTVPIRQVREGYLIEFPPAEPIR